MISFGLFPAGFADSLQEVRVQLFTDQLYRWSGSYDQTRGKHIVQIDTFYYMYRELTQKKSAKTGVKYAIKQ